MPSIPAMLAEVAANAIKSGAKGKTLELMDPFINLRKELGTVAPKSTAPQPAIRAFHGSPHSFDKFSLDKIGTGEGNQSFGHGLYFAENEGIAKSYRDQLSKKAIDGKPLDQVKREGAFDTLKMRPATPESEIADYLDSYGDVQTTRMMLDRKGRWDLIDKLDELVSSGRLKADGSMYEVKINADPEHFLDWDKPLSEQSEAARLAAAKAMKMPLPKDGSAPTFEAGLDPSPTGEQFHSMLGDQMYGGKDTVAARLNEAGIPGIKYRDAGSRGADAAKGSHNYVVFDDSLIEIVKKYGIAAALGAGLISQEMAAQMQEQGIDKEAGGILDTPGILGGPSFPDYRRKA